MIKRNNKKGFTIVELVIVIAVIAILAAVLIPTFSGIIKKANISKDTQLAKNLNTILLSEEAEGNKPADFSEVLSVLRENGYVVENLNPTTEGYYFVWESTTNQILLVDESFKLSYSSKDLEDGVATIGATWFFAVKDATLIDAIKTAGGSVIPAVDSAWLNNDANKLTALFKDLGAGETSTIILNEAITLSQAPTHSSGSRGDGIRAANGQILNFNLAGQTMTVTADFDTSFIDDGTKSGYRIFQIGSSSVLNLSDGSIVGSAKSNANGLSTYGVVRSFGTSTINVENMEIMFTGAPDVGSGAAGSVFSITDNSVLNLKDTTITITNTTALECAATATLENVTIKLADGTSQWNSTCIAASNNGVINVKSGTYTAGSDEGYCFGVLPTGGTINISGGTFDGDIYFDADAGKTATINITGGTFEGKSFNALTEAEWRAKLGGCDDTEKAAVVITGAGTNNVTIKLAK